MPNAVKRKRKRDGGKEIADRIFLAGTGQRNRKSLEYSTRDTRKINLPARRDDKQNQNLVLTLYTINESRNVWDFKSVQHCGTKTAVVLAERPLCVRTAF